MTIAGIKRHLAEDGENAVKAILIIMIRDLVAFLNVGMTMSNEQCAQTIDLIIQDYFYFNLSDFKLCFDRIKKGEYGLSYNRIDGQIILLALAEYAETRSQIAEQIMQKKHKELKSEQTIDYFYIVLADGYLKQTDDNQYETSDKEHATQFEEKEALSLKKAIQSEKCTLERVNTFGNTFTQWLKENGLEAPKNDKSGINSRTIRNIQIQVHKIEIDPNLSDLEKTNRKRMIAGLYPLTEQEFEDRNKIK
jgi:hypothetical protein